MHKLSALIKRHPRIEHGVEVEVVKDGFVVESFVAVLDTLEDSIERASVLLKNMFPMLGKDDVDVQLPHGLQRDKSDS